MNGLIVLAGRMFLMMMWGVYGKWHRRLIVFYGMYTDVEEISLREEFIKDVCNSKTQHETDFLPVWV